jgi:hypothetical protein
VVGDAVTWQMGVACGDGIVPVTDILTIILCKA